MITPYVSAVARKLFASLITVAFLVSAFSCSRKGKAIGEIEKQFESENHKEVVFLCQRALDDNVESGKIHYYYGLSLLALGRDFESFTQLERAIALDGGFSGLISRTLFEAGVDDVGKRRSKRAAIRLMKAAQMDTALVLNEYSYLVADECYRDRNFFNAAFFYEQALALRPDTAIAGMSMMRLAESYARLDSVAPAESVYTSLLERFPRGEYANDARWNLASSLLERAGHELEAGNHEEALSLGEELLKITKNVTLMQNTRFLMGEAYEGLSDYDAALEQYKMIIQYDRGASGSVVQKARGKIDSYRRAGLMQ
jgi:tetratricopeptide (TPR) repeat protein